MGVRFWGAKLIGIVTSNCCTVVAKTLTDQGMMVAAYLHAFSCGGSRLGCWSLTVYVHVDQKHDNRFNLYIYDNRDGY